jgi:hypothetical protein
VHRKTGSDIYFFPPGDYCAIVRSDVVDFPTKQTGLIGGWENLNKNFAFNFYFDRDSTDSSNRLTRAKLHHRLLYLFFWMRQKDIDGNENE